MLTVAYYTSTTLKSSANISVSNAKQGLLLLPSASVTGGINVKVNTFIA